MKIIKGCERRVIYMWGTVGWKLPELPDDQRARSLSVHLPGTGTPGAASVCSSSPSAAPHTQLPEPEWTSRA